jgi:hypothetical protein
MVSKSILCLHHNRNLFAAKVHNPAATLGDIAASKATSGMGVYAVIQKFEPKPKAMKPGLVWTPGMVEEIFAGTGVGRKSIAQIIKSHGLDKKTVSHRLKGSGIEAKDDDKINILADKHNSTPHQDIDHHVGR